MTTSAPPIARRLRHLIVGTAFALALSIAIGLFVISKSRTFQFFGEIIPRVETTQPTIALTFDDGPTSDHTPHILEILRQKGVRATFFMIGQDLEKRLEVAKRLVQEGHQPGNHSYSHRRMVLVTHDFVASEIERTDDLIRQTGYTGDILFRPPYGKKLFSLPRYLAANNRKTITWDIEPESDPSIAGNPVAIASHVIEAARPGSIILLHGMYKSGKPTIDALPTLIDGLLARGFRFVTVGELLALR